MLITERVTGSARRGRPLTMMMMVVAAAALTGMAGVAAAQDAQDVQDAAPAAPNLDAAETLEDFVHYARIAKPELAAAYGEALLQAAIPNSELALVLEETNIGEQRFREAIARSLYVPELEDIAAELGRRVNEGFLDLARDTHRIERSVQELVGNQRQKMEAVKRLKAAGEYAVPTLLRTITESQDQKLVLACERMIEEIGRQAVTPLCEALTQLDSGTQRTVCDLLGAIGWSHASAYLRELGLDESIDTPVRDAANRAFRAVGGVEADLTELFSDLGYQYYRGDVSLVAFPYEDMNNVWSYDPFVGLVHQPVATDIYSEVMAMRLAARALGSESTNQRAISLYVASNLKRENDLPEGMSDPIFGEASFSPEYYATVFGTQVCLDVLALALDTTDTPLVRDAIAALAQTTGGSNLFARGEGRQPLLEALAYPDRRVQYEAALTLGRALPDEGFNGDYRVVPLLASAVRTANQSFALIVADDTENRQEMVVSVEQLGFTIEGAEDSVAALRQAIAEAVGVDLVVVRMNQLEAAVRVVGDIRQVAKISAVPILLVASAVDAPEIGRQFRGDPRVMVVRPRGAGAFGENVDVLLTRAAGGRITEAESEVYAIEALSTLRDIAISRTPAYSVADAETALLDALQARSGGTRTLVADTLALIDSDRAQRALFDAALAATGGERVDLLDRVAASVKRWGDRAEQRHVTALLDLVLNSSGTTAEAAARVHGALNLVAPDSAKLIPIPE